MRKIKRNIQISFVILFYACIIFIAFSISVIHIQKQMNQNNAMGYFDTMKEDCIDANTQINEQMFFEDPIKAYQQQRVKDLYSFQEYYDTKLISTFIPSAIIFCIIIMIATWLLWLLLKKINQKDIKRIANSLNHIQKNHINEVDDPILRDAFDHIKKEYQQHFEDDQRLTSYLTHEQKNTLALLRSNLELGHMEESFKNLNQLNEGIDDILTMAEQKDNGQMQEVDVVLACAQVMDTYMTIYPDIDFQFDETKESFIYAKKRWIIRAISNLVDNAIKYGNQKPIQVMVYHAHHSVVVKVSDQGAGIDEKEQEKIFEHRYRIHELKKDGYGIGLSLVQHVCALCGGFVYVESIPHKETSFYLSFPTIQENAQ